MARVADGTGVAVGTGVGVGVGPGVGVGVGVGAGTPKLLHWSSIEPLTTFAQPKETMARMALRMALDLLDGYDASARIILSGKLVVRESTTRCSP